MAAVASAEHFTVTQVAHGEQLKSGVVHLAHAMRKYGLAPNKNITTAENAALAHGSVVTTPQQFDREYLTPVKVGAQTLMLDFDTGSSDLWVFSTEQPAAQQAGHTAFKCSAPLVGGATWQIKYGDGTTAGGNVKKAAVSIGGLTVAGQEVECAKHVAAQFVKDKNLDGLLGLGFDNINQVRPNPAKTWFTNIKPKLDAPVFAANLKHQAPGTYDFGFIDSSKYTGNIAYTAVDPSEGYW
ncbi:MAG: hypothetical protein INR71_15705, partial [Terriglobus roseus]|nr:hypothetical protein [Terriglobus roseus]